MRGPEAFTSPSGRRIAFVINSLTAGGAERALVDLLAGMRDRLADFEVHLILLDREEERHAPPAWVHKHVLDARGGFLASISRLMRLLQTLRPVMTVSFLARANCASVVAGQILGHPCVISERVQPSSHFQSSRMRWMNKAIVRSTYRFADNVIAVSEGVRNDLINNYGISGCNVEVVYNPIDVQKIIRRSLEKPAFALPDRYIVGVGRLTRNKNFRLLIEAYAASGVSESVIILGDGGERPYLERLVGELRLEGRVLFVGYVDNPYPIIKAARLFVSPSNAEGFPNALVEALALGCPVVATDCDSGPLEILTGQITDRCDGVMLGGYGVLVPTESIECLAAAIRTACRDDVRTTYSRRGPERARDFDVTKAVTRYWSAIAACAGGGTA